MRIGSAGVTVELPAGWHATKGNDGNITDPLTRIVVSSGPIDAGSSECQSQITNYSFTDYAVVLVFVEWWGPARSGSPGPRPSDFTEANLPVKRSALECYAGMGGAAFFEDQGRDFGAYLYLGERASPRLADDARTVLDTLEVRPARPRT